MWPFLYKYDNSSVLSVKYIIRKIFLQKKAKQKMSNKSFTPTQWETSYFAPLFLFMLWWISDWNENEMKWKKRGLSDEYVYQVWFQFVQWYKRGWLGCKSLRKMTDYNDGRQVFTIIHMTLCATKIIET